VQPTANRPVETPWDCARRRSQLFKDPVSRAYLVVQFGRGFTVYHSTATPFERVRKKTTVLTTSAQGGCR
jgi:hypothetical protein